MFLGEIAKGENMGEVEYYYDHKAKSYEESFNMLYFKIFDAITWKYLEPYIPTSTDALVLDAGGGTGRWSIRMAMKGCKVVLMDASEEMLKIAAEKLERTGLKNSVVLKKGDITRIDYANNTFDMIFCEHTLFLFEKPDIVLKELYRVLKKNSRLIVSVHNRYVQSLVSLSENPDANNVTQALNVLLCKKHGALDSQGKIKIYTWSPSEFREMLERNGFLVEKIVGKGYSMPLRISKDAFMKKDYANNLFEKLLEFELAFCEKTDALALAGHLQAIAYKP